MSGVDALNGYFIPTHSYTNEEGKNVILPQNKEEPYSSSLGDKLDSSGGRLDPAPLNDWPHRFKDVQADEHL